MKVSAEHAAGMSASTMAALMLAVFTVSVGFGVVLPHLPDLIERLLGAGVEAAQVSLHTGLLTAAYTLALFLFSPLWGRLSDRRGPRGVLLIGLIGFGLTMLVFSFVETLAAVYAARLLSGMFAAAVTPVASAVIGNFVTTEQGRARQLAFVSMASIAGFLFGPMLGMLATRFAGNFFLVSLPAGSLAIPLVATALLAIFMTFVVAFAVPNGEARYRSLKMNDNTVDQPAGLMPKLLGLTFIVSAGV